MEKIVVKGAREHNLKNVDLEIPRDKLVVFTGLSGSGKSTLAFDTIFAEGQRRYLESLSSYARQFLGQMDKPDVDYIEGLSPAISISQKSAPHNPRSTVGTVTEIHDYLRLLFAKIGRPHCPECGREIKSLTTEEIVERILDLGQKLENKKKKEKKTKKTAKNKDKIKKEISTAPKIEILAPVVRERKGEYLGLLEEMFKKGFSRARVDGAEVELIRWKKVKLARHFKHSIDIIVDELEIQAEEISRIFEAVEIALSLAQGLVKINQDFRLRRTSSLKPTFRAQRIYQYASHEALPAGRQVRVSPRIASERVSPANSEDSENKKSESQNKSKSKNEDKKDKKEKVEPEGTLILNQKLACPIHETEFPPLEPRLFSFNSPFGACPVCEGLGTRREIDPERVMPDRNKTLAEGGLIPWSYRKNNYYGFLFRAVCQAFSISENKRLRDLSAEELQILLHGPDEEYSDEVRVKYHFKSGSGYHLVRWRGIIRHLQDRYRKTESEAVRREIEKYMNNKVCSACSGTRYRPEVLLVKINQKNIAEISDLSVRDTLAFFDNLKLNSQEKIIADRIVKEIKNRLSFLNNVGLDYLNLGRSANTLSGGEAQRIRLASQIGSGLVGVLYILDEPSIGLHARDNQKLLETLTRLRDLGNTVVVIEHDEETIRQADHIVDIGPGAGRLGGKVVHSGALSSLLKNKKSVTAQYLLGDKKIEKPKIRRKVDKKKMLVIRSAAEHNLKNITVEIPTRVFTCVTGVSGSGKSTLVEDVLYKWLANRLHRSLDVPGKVKEILSYHLVNKVIMIDQSPIGRTPRSNPATYTGVFTPIRTLFSKTEEARRRGYQPGRFSFNVPGGRCENCKGDGYLKIEMQFMPDVYLPCDVCHETRYGSETLKVRYKNKNIAEILNLTVNEAVEFFKNHPEIFNKLKTLQDVGLGYIHLGQSATTLSGGEAQRIKLASELSRRNTGNTLYILDEPTTGLHFDDVKKLLNVLNRLVDAGNTVVVIEHNLDVLKTADWIIDLGPEGGENGGRVVVSGTPEEVAKWHKESFTGKYLRSSL